MADRRRLPLMTAIAGSVVIGLAGCGDEPTPAAEAAPDIDRMCGSLDRELDAIALARGPEVTVDDVKRVEDAFLAGSNLLSSDETTVGRSSSLIGNPIRQSRRALDDLIGMYTGRDATADTAEVSSELDLGLAGINEGAAAFGIDACLDTETIRADLQPLIDGVEVVLAELAPTGDFEVDFAAACERFRVDVADAVLETLQDSMGDIMGPIRMAGVMVRFDTELGNLSPPAEVQDRYDTLRSGVESAERAADAVAPARVRDQQAVDEAMDALGRAEVAIDEAIAAIDLDC